MTRLAALYLKAFSIEGVILVIGSLIFYFFIEKIPPGIIEKVATEFELGLYSGAFILATLASACAFKLRVPLLRPNMDVRVFYGWGSFKQYRNFIELSVLFVVATELTGVALVLLNENNLARIGTSLFAAHILAASYSLWSLNFAAQRLYEIGVLNDVTSSQS